jgi:hypothetical protein
MNQPLSIPLVDRSLVAGLYYGVRIATVASCLAAAMWLLDAKVRRVASVLAVVAWLIVVACLSGLFWLLPTINQFYDRYQSVLRHATTSAPGFTEGQFSKVALGQSTGELLTELGEPLSRIAADGSEIWVYSAIGVYHDFGEKGFHQRAVVVDEGRVVKVIRRYLTAEDVPF